MLWDESAVIRSKAKGHEGEFAGSRSVDVTTALGTVARVRTFVGEPDARMSDAEAEAHRSAIRQAGDTEAMLREVEAVGLNDWPTKGATAKRLLGDAADSRERHTFERDGVRVYTAERAARHDLIVGQELAGALEHVLGPQHPHVKKLRAGGRLTEDEKREVRVAVEAHRGGASPRALFLAGGPASGKTTALKANPALEPEAAVTVNPDEMKNQVPEYREMVQGGDRFAAAGVHEESSDLAKRLQTETMDLGLNVVVDGTGDSKRGKFLGKMEAMDRAGYQVDSLYVSRDTEESVAWATVRALRTGRWVPEPELRAQHKHVSANFPDVAAAGFVGNMKLYVNEGRDSFLVAEGSQGQIQVRDQARYEAFLAKAAE
jgi:predicted ABC-type ATPase